MYNMVTIFDNTVLYNWYMLREFSSKNKKVNMWGGGCIC